MIDTMTDEDLLAIGLADPAQARRSLLSLAGQGVTDDLVSQLMPSLLDALRQSPDPDRALISFVRWTEAVTNRYTHFQYLLRHSTALVIFCKVCGVSQFFADILIRNPEYFEILANPNVRSKGKSAGALFRQLSDFVDTIGHTELRWEAMRRFKQREVLRIGTRDILGLADMPATAREFSHLADACVQKCYEIARLELHNKEHPAPFAVIAMGKLGGEELNYSSDIDLLFVCADETPAGLSNPSVSSLGYAHKVAEIMVNALSKVMQNGHLFRVDVRLRPEGRFGALVRTLSSYRAYYESWAEPWERQALIKARPIAGDETLGDAFREMVLPMVYRRSITSDFVEAIRSNKERIEKRAELERQTHSNVKIGFGGIRDIEFAVQLLQLELGGRNSRLRTSTTLEAITRLRKAGVLSAREAEELDEDYRFLRTVEHRLQILYERQTQSLPADANERRLLARRLGYPDADAFDADYAFRTHRVRGHFEDLFYGERRDESAFSDEWHDLLANVETPTARAAIEERLQQAGFYEPARGYEILKIAAFGGDYGIMEPGARRLFPNIAASLVAACARMGDPDAALNGIEALAQAMPSRAPLYRMLTGNEDLTDRLCRLAAYSPSLMRSLTNHQEWLDMLVSEEMVDPEPASAKMECHEFGDRGLFLTVSYRNEQGTRGFKAEEIERAEEENPILFWDELARLIQRERLRIGARDVWGEIGTREVGEELTALADATLAALTNRSLLKTAARFPGEEARNALAGVIVMGLGKLGGRELSYGSDWDILVVYDQGKDEAFAAVNAFAELLLSAGQELRTRGVPVEIDARLRPEGRFGALARSVDDYCDYYLRSALTWEKQTLLKARPIAGHRKTGLEFDRVLETAFGTPFSDQQLDEIRQMKRRMENERLKVGERYRNVKLGYGGMADIEFTVQLHQLRSTSTRSPQTTAALHWLARDRAIPASDAERLKESYTHWTALRNRLSLLNGLPTDVLPSDLRRLRALAGSLGVREPANEESGSLLLQQCEEQMREIRAIVERLFYES